MTNQIIDKRHCDEHSRKLGEQNDCVVYACAVATQIDYPTMHKYITDMCKRKPGKGTSVYQYHAALTALGFRLEKLAGPYYNWTEHYVEESSYFCWKSGKVVYRRGHYRNRKVKVADGEDYSSSTVTTLARELATGTYLVGTSGHVLCLREGEVHDWTEGRRHIVRDVYRVTEAVTPSDATVVDEVKMRLKIEPGKRRVFGRV